MGGVSRMISKLKKGVTDTLTWWSSSACLKNSTIFVLCVCVLGVSFAAVPDTVKNVYCVKFVTFWLLNLF